MKALAESSDKTRVLKESFLANASYKLVALFISLILWMSILGQRDFVVTKEVEIEFNLKTGYMISSQSVDKIKVKLSGAQSLLKKFKENPAPIIIDAIEKTTGMYETDILISKIEVPKGVKVLGLRPTSIRFEITESEKSESQKHESQKTESQKTETSHTEKQNSENSTIEKQNTDIKKADQ